jgi:hypothetical protein
MRRRVALPTQQDKVRKIVIRLLKVRMMDAQRLGGPAFPTLIAVSLTNKLPHFSRESWRVWKNCAAVFPSWIQRPGNGFGNTSPPFGIERKLQSTLSSGFYLVRSPRLPNALRNFRAG